MKPLFLFHQENEFIADGFGRQQFVARLFRKSLKVLELGKDFSNAEFNIQVQMGVTDEQKRELMQSIAAQKALGDQTNGAQGLSPAEYMYIYDRVIGGNIREAMYVMAQIQQKKAQVAAQQKQQDIQANAQAQQASAQQKGQIDQQNIVTKGQVDGKNDVMMELVKGLMEQNKSIMDNFMKSQADMGKPVSADAAQAHVAANNQQIGAIVQSQVQPQDQQQAQPEAQPQDMSQMQPQDAA